MLVLTRKNGESIVLGNDIEIKVVAIRGQKVRLAIDAPCDVAVHRKEVFLTDRTRRWDAGVGPGGRFAETADRRAC